MRKLRILANKITDMAEFILSLSLAGLAVLFVSLFLFAVLLFSLVFFGIV